MTWWTCCGLRYLRDAEAKLFAYALLQIVNEHDDDDDYMVQYTHGQFDRLSTNNEKFQVLEVVAFYLLRNTGERNLRLSALVESAVFYVFSWYLQEFKDNFENSVEQWGALIIDAFKQELERCPDDHNGDEEFLPTITNFPLSAWLSAIEFLADGILWDRDFEMEEDLKTAAPCMFDIFKIAKSYVSPILDDDNENVVQYSDNAKQDLYQLCCITINTHYLDEKHYLHKINLYKSNDVITLY